MLDKEQAGQIALLISPMPSSFSLPASIFFGLPLMTAAAFMAADLLYFHSTRELSQSELSVVASTVERTLYVPAPPRGWARNEPKDHIDVWLKGDEHPFRFGPEWFHLTTLRPGTPLSMGLDPDATRRPLQPTFLRPEPCYRPLTVRLSDGWRDVHLAQDNQSVRTNLKLFPWLSPALALLGLFMSTRIFTDFCHRQARSKYGPRRKPLKGRLSLGLLKSKD